MIKKLQFFIFFFSFTILQAQNASFCNELKAIKDIVSSSHYQPKIVNDSLSKGVFWLFIKQLDQDQRFFLQSDIDLFKKDEFYLDNYLEKDYCEFIDGYAKILEQRILESKEILAFQQDKQLDYSGVDSLYYSPKNTYHYFKDKTAAKAYWSKRIRYKLLRKLVENDSNIESIKKSFKVLEEQLKPKIIENEICLLEELEQSKGSIKRLVETAFLDAFLKYQDPNSAYLSAADKTLFDQSVANSQFTFGIRTQKRKNGDIVIAYISPGSSAFKHGDLDIDDVILSLANSTETLDIYCTSNETVTDFINDARIDVVTFRIKKKNGQIKSIKLRKSNLEIADNSITGYILKGNHNAGYIKIPSFYTDLESVNGLGVSNDVAKQIYKLQQEGIEALIIDLRFNGGGSMKEATDLSGMFIDRGPVAISKVRGEQTYTIRDPNRGTIFSKPIVVLVDQFSASASEFFAAAMQDYNRAIIVGSATHGKASSQFVAPITKHRNSNFLKLTTGQFFRVTGRSHQQTGIIPDITLPSIYDHYETQEFTKPFALSNSSVEVIMPHRPQPKKSLTDLADKSAERISNSKVFKGIKAFNKIFVDGYVNREGKYPLNLEFVFNDNTTYEDAWQNYSELTDNTESAFEVVNTKSTTTILSYNASDKALNEKLRKDLSRDPYIQEAFHIIEDILKL